MKKDADGNVSMGQSAGVEIFSIEDYIQLIAQAKTAYKAVYTNQYIQIKNSQDLYPVFDSWILVYI